MKKQDLISTMDFTCRTLRRKPRSAALILADERARLRQHSITQLDECFGEFITAKRLDHNQQGLFSRRGFIQQSNTFWAFILFKCWMC